MFTFLRIAALLSQCAVIFLAIIFYPQAATAAVSVTTPQLESAITSFLDRASGENAGVSALDTHF